MSKGKDITTFTVLQPFRDLLFRKKYNVRCGWCGRIGKINKVPKHPGQIVFTSCSGCKKDGALTYSSPRVMI